ncbi:MAG: DMT family transporter [Bacteroidales bacterium]|nr:DMT family transporter [Bacteroidales bacterium]
MYYLFASVILYSFNNVLWKFFVKNEHPLHLISRRAVFTVLIAFAAVWYTGVDVGAYLHNPKALYVFAGSILGVAGLVLMVTFLKTGSLVRMGYYSLVGTFLAAAYTYMFREAPVTGKTLIGAAIIITGYLVFLLDEKRRVKTEPAILSQHLLLIGMTLCFATSMLIQWEQLKVLPPLAIITTQEVVVLTITLIASIFIKPVIEKVSGGITLRNTAIMAAVIFAGIFTGTLGLKTADPFLASLTGMMSPVLTVFGGSLVFKDKLRPVHYITLTLMVAGGVVLG